jgi:hypothetical protein
LNFSISFIILRESSLNPSCNSTVLQLLSKLRHVIFSNQTLVKNIEKEKRMTNSVKKQFPKPGTGMSYIFTWKFFRLGSNYQLEVELHKKIVV